MIDTMTKLINWKIYFRLNIYQQSPANILKIIWSSILLFRRNQLSEKWFTAVERCMFIMVHQNLGFLCNWSCWGISAIYLILYSTNQWYVVTQLGLPRALSQVTLSIVCPLFALKLCTPVAGTCWVYLLCCLQEEQSLYYSDRLHYTIVYIATALGFCCIHTSGFTCSAEKAEVDSSSSSSNSWMNMNDFSDNNGLFLNLNGISNESTNVLHYSYIKGIIKSSRTLNFISTTPDLKNYTTNWTMSIFIPVIFVC